MFKDFHRRLQRDLKKIVDARVVASEARLGGEIKVSILDHLFSFNTTLDRDGNSWKAILICFVATSHNLWKSM